MTGPPRDGHSETIRWFPIALLEPGAPRNFHLSVPVVALSQQLGLDRAKLLKDMQDPAITKILERNYQLANALGINGTPAFVIGERMIPGAVDAAGMAEIIAQERAKKKAAGTPGQ